ncbi:hypothetical protein [Alkalihalobacillus deserti]|nr:hypothetical protein [Alkalihalobacillus deserti]
MSENNRQVSYQQTLGTKTEIIRQTTKEQEQNSNRNNNQPRNEGDFQVEE